jgi:hypothetical protein
MTTLTLTFQVPDEYSELELEYYIREYFTVSGLSLALGAHKRSITLPFLGYTYILNAEPPEA